MKSHAPKARLKDIAQMAQMSVATVSMALADHPNINATTKRRVREIGRKLGYRRKTPTLPAKKTCRIGLMIVGAQTHDGVHVPMMSQLSEASLRHGVRLEFTATEPGMAVDQQFERAMQFAQNLQGLLLVDLVTDALLARLSDAGIHAVVMGDVYGQFTTPSQATVVAFDSLGMGYAATSRLLDAGHRKVAYVDEFLHPGLMHDRWHKGYHLAFQERGLPVDPLLVQVTGQLRSGAGPAVANWSARKKWPDAFVVPSARVAASLIEALGRQGRDVAPGSLICQGMGPAFTSPELAHHGQYVGRIDLLAQYAVTRLLEACRLSQPQPMRLIVPHEAVNLPTLPTGDGKR